MNVIRRLYYNIMSGFAHAAYHRHLRKMTLHRTRRDLVKFKQSVHNTENAWRKIVYYKQKLK
jgi:hypothetical protein